MVSKQPFKDNDIQAGMKHLDDKCGDSRMRSSGTAEDFWEAFAGGEENEMSCKDGETRSLGGRTEMKQTGPAKPNVEIRKRMYLVEKNKIAKEYSRAKNVFNGEMVQVIINTINYERCDLRYFRIGDIAERGFDTIKESIRVYRGNERLVPDKDYVVIIPGAGANPNGYEDFNLLVELADEVQMGERVTLVFNAFVRTDPTKTIMYSSGIATFVRGGMSEPEMVMTRKMPICVVSPAISIRKSAAPSAVTIGEHIEYTMLVTNTGNTPLTNVILSDTAIEDYLAAGNLTFDEANPIKINGVDAGNTLPINIGDIPVFENKVVTIRVLASNVPAGAQYINVSNAIADSIKLDRGCEEDANEFIPEAESNTIVVKVLSVQLNIAKTADKAEAENGEEIQYTIVLQNQSNVILYDVIVNDILDENTRFIPGSVVIDGTPAAGANIRTGVNIGEIGAAGSQTPADSRTITYRARVDLGADVNLAQELNNLAYATFLYSRAPGADPESGRTQEVTYPVRIARPSLTAVKTQDMQYVVTGDNISYVLTLNNNGNKAFNLITVTDDLPDGLQQIVDVQTTNLDGTIVYNTVNDVLLESGLQVVGPASGKESLQAGESMLVKFTAAVENIPPESFTNSARICYTYQVQLQAGNVNRENCIDTNAVTATGINPVLSVVKSVSPESVAEGDTAEYTLTVTNAGNTTIQNVRLTDPLDPALTLTQDYTLVNGVQVFERITDADGVTLPQILAGDTVRVQFEVRYTTVPPTEVNNITNYQYYYIKDPSQDPVLVDNNRSNQVTLRANQPAASLRIVKSSLDQTVLNQGVVTYNLTFTNTGNRDLMDIRVIDTIPTGMNFVSESVTVGNNIVAGGDITTGIVIGSLAVNADPILVSFQAKVVTPPASGVFDNVASASFNYMVGDSILSGSAISNVHRIHLAQIDLVRTQNQSVLQVGSQITHTLTTTNTGNTPLGSVTLSDIVDPRLAVDPSTIRVNGASTTDSLTNLSLPDLQPLESAVVTYSGTVTSRGNGSPLVNTATVNGVTIDSKNATDNESISTAIVEQSTGIIYAFKTVSSDTALIGDVLTYQIIINNRGLNDITSINLQDTLNSNAALVPGSIMVNGIQSTGTLQSIIVRGLVTNATAVVSFKARVTGCGTGNLITNSAFINYVVAGTSLEYQTNGVETIILDDYPCYTVSIQIPIPQYYEYIGNLINISPQLINVIPINGGNAITVNYSVQIDYQTVQGLAQTYTFNGAVNIETPFTSAENNINLTMRNVKVIGRNRITGDLIIRIY